MYKIFFHDTAFPISKKEFDDISDFVYTYIYAINQAHAQKNVLSKITFEKKLKEKIKNSKNDLNKLFDLTLELCKNNFVVNPCFYGLMSQKDFSEEQLEELLKSTFIDFDSKHYPIMNVYRNRHKDYRPEGIKFRNFTKEIYDDLFIYVVLSYVYKSAQKEISDAEGVKAWDKAYKKDDNIIHYSNEKYATSRTIQRFGQFKKNTNKYKSFPYFCYHNDKNVSTKLNPLDIEVLKNIRSSSSLKNNPFCVEAYNHICLRTNNYDSYKALHCFTPELFKNFLSEFEEFNIKNDTNNIPFSHIDLFTKVGFTFGKIENIHHRIFNQFLLEKISNINLINMFFKMHQSIAKKFGKRSGILDEQILDFFVNFNKLPLLNFRLKFLKDFSAINDEGVLMPWIAVASSMVQNFVCYLFPLIEIVFTYILELARKEELAQKEAYNEKKYTDDYTESTLSNNIRNFFVDLEKNDYGFFQFDTFEKQIMPSACKFTGMKISDTYSDFASSIYSYHSYHESHSNFLNHYKKTNDIYPYFFMGNFLIPPLP